MANQRNLPVSKDDSILTQIDYYEELFDPTTTDRDARRHRKPRQVPLHDDPTESVAQLTDEARGLEGGFTTTYHPARYEAGWLQDSLRSFYEQHLIVDVLARIKGGKEATVYRCAAHPSTGHVLLAAKVYRPRMFRNLRNDKLYRQGRAILKEDGRTVNDSDHRILRALGKKTAFGVQVAHTSWLMHEFTTLQRLHRAGGAVPEPIAANDNAILMGYCGDERQSAPTLNEVRLRDSEAGPLYREALRNVALLLQHGLIHGDLSAYNILYWQGRITLIDFPQVTNSHANNAAQFILQRDVTRLCEYFARQGVTCDSVTVMADLWQHYADVRLADVMADLSRNVEE
jgi:RIO kinase 1